MKSPYDRLHESLSEVTPEMLARIEARADASVSEKHEVEWDTEPDPLGMDWSWRPSGMLDTSTVSSPGSLMGNSWQSTFARHDRRGWWSVVAALILLALGIGIGKYSFRQNPAASIVASAVVRLEKGFRGDDRTIPMFEITSDHPGFLTIVVLGSDKRIRPEVVPIAPAADVPVAALPQVNSFVLPEHLVGSAMALVIVTKTPAADTLDKELSRHRFAAGDGHLLEKTVRDILSSRGFDAIATVQISIPRMESNR